jgi:adenosylmethionine-8-amino-7-oxononanoate aminotransferase
MMQEMPKFRHLVRIWTKLIRTTRGAYYADMLETQILHEGAETVLAFLVEPVAGPQLALVPPAGCWSAFEICVIMASLDLDEVMTGAGRTQVELWHWSVRPDIVAMSKGLGRVYARGAVIADEKIVKCSDG